MLSVADHRRQGGGRATYLVTWLTFPVLRRVATADSGQESNVTEGQRSRRRSRLAALVGSAVVSLTVFALVALLGDCGDGAGADHGAPERACTLIACGPGMRIDLRRLPDDARAVRVCIRGACGDAQPIAQPATVTASLPPAVRRDGAVVGVAVRVLDDEGKVIDRMAGSTEVRRTLPNGPGCPPTCLQARLGLAGTG